MVGELIDRLREIMDVLAGKWIGIGIVLGCLVVAALVAGIVFAADRSDEAAIPTGGLTAAQGEDVGSGAQHVAVSAGDGGGFGSGDGVDAVPQGNPSSTWVSTEERVRRHEALPCTGPKEPINFEIFSAGPSIAGVPLTDFRRRCGGTTPADEPPANYTSYIYGDCNIAEGATGCKPPLEIQTWPACERSLAEYSFQGKPIPRTRLPSRNGAEVQEIVLPFGPPRIEVYSKSSTVVIFANDSALAREALGQLRSQEQDTPPATQAVELAGKPDEGLEPPSDGATEGELQCQS